MPTEDDAPITARDLTDRGFYTCTSVEHAIAPPILIEREMEAADVREPASGLWQFEVRPVCHNHILRVRPVRASYFQGKRGEQSAMKIVARDLDRVAITSGRYGQIHVYFLGVPVDLFAWQYEQCVYIRRRFTTEQWNALSPIERTDLDAFHQNTHAF